MPSEPSASPETQASVSTEKASVPPPGSPPASTSVGWLETSSRLVQVVSVVVGVVISVISVNTTRQQQAQAENATRQQQVQADIAESRRRAVEAAKPFLEMQQKRYEETLHTIAVLATPENHTAAERATATQRFWDLKWSELGMVEGPEVHKAMEKVASDLFKKNRGDAVDTLHEDIFQLSLAMRSSLMGTWGIDPQKLK
jgi:hypothetical protein